MHITYLSIWVQSLIVHGRNPRLHVCFDKVNNGPTYKIISGLIFIFTNHKWPHTPQSEWGVGYILKLAIPSKFATSPSNLSRLPKFNYFVNV